MSRHLISDAHEWINEIPTVPTLSSLWFDRHSRFHTRKHAAKSASDILDISCSQGLHAKPQLDVANYERHINREGYP